MPALKINHIPINRFKEDISDMKSSSQATALSQIRQFIDFESKKRKCQNIRIRNY